MEPEEAVDLYLEAWNAAGDGERLELVRRAFTSDADRFGHDVAHGPDAIAATMSQIGVKRTSAVQVQGDWSRLLGDVANSNLNADLKLSAGTESKITIKRMIRRQP